LTAKNKVFFVEITGITGGKNGTLFDLEPYVAPEPERKKPATQAEKDLARIEDMERRELNNLERKLLAGKTLTAAERQALDGYRQRFGIMTGAALPEGIVKTQREVAERFGKHVQTIKNWCKEDMPRNPDSYDLEAIKAWAISKEYIKPDPEESHEPVPVVDGLGAPVANSKAYYELEVKKEQAEKLRLANEERRGELIPKEDVEAGRVARITVVKSAMLSAPRTWAPRFVGLNTAREAEALLKELMLGLCARFAEG